MTDLIKVQHDDFNVAEQYQQLIQNNQQDGAVVFFVGLVRDFNQQQSIKSLTLEHYPAMTEKVLNLIVEQAREKWPLGRISVVHRVGTMQLGEQIVFVGVTSQHRQAAFEAGQFIMDILKTQAPFWKKEQTEQGSHWVDAKESDQTQAQTWLK
ncbi:molybdenum cofactor biosynthesis protein E [Catenovulum agarivorans DS-2]|uniref:Molybdopterin synthase catalytic subunit n=1 Tax=Catenovulum agarivorans DS-2 TaxID=1328313 RepID=W7QV17_9ALTE|nr:molybdopterin synthase catalytic subunit MoaE [Catenovulum agarivorans]EWH11558.1 molybdenum cofactor biosynthesis protein E [Catenovulum agarivorans DS-2]